jgi:hypothetical protein
MNMAQPSARALRSRVLAIDTPDDLESFDLGNVSGSDDDDPGPPVQRACHNHTGDEPTVAQIINNPNPKPPKLSMAADVHHYFETIGTQQVCKECVYIFLLDSFDFFF